MSNREQAEKDYLSGMKYKDIADKYQVSLNTVKSWKKRYGWQRTPTKKGARKAEKRVCTKSKKVAPKNKGSSGDLTPQQEAFAWLVGGQKMPLYRAYLEAYKVTGPSVASAMRESSRLNKNKKVHERIVEISQETARKYHWSLERVIDSYTFLHDESKTDIVTHGIRKATADAMLQSLEDITDVLGLKQSSKAQIRKATAEAKIAEAKAKEIQKVNQHDDSTLIVNDLEDTDNGG
ncbi:terminase gpP N-terminus-related DNA-binding protein [Lentilactobacillus hilgardii]|uniref:terminase gpP N-terminus-related DNA-binding protein n=1 Tax=Lentilactobacillus hilgardii TaxID=1588 RepID=UPI00390C5339